MTQWWRSIESTRLPPAWPGFDSRTRRHIWVEFVVGSRPCSEIRGFFLALQFYPLLKKTTSPNSNWIWIIVKHLVLDNDFIMSLWLGEVAQALSVLLALNKLLFFHICCEVICRRLEYRKSFCTHDLFLYLFNLFRTSDPCRAPSGTQVYSLSLARGMLNTISSTSISTFN